MDFNPEDLEARMHQLMSESRVNVTGKYVFPITRSKPLNKNLKGINLRATEVIDVDLPRWLLVKLIENAEERNITIDEVVFKCLVEVMGLNEMAETWLAGIGLPKSES